METGMGMVSGRSWDTELARPGSALLFWSIRLLNLSRLTLGLSRKSSRLLLQVSSDLVFVSLSSEIGVDDLGSTQ